jgi:PKD repeat protein
MKHCLIAVLLTMAMQCFSQGENNFWYFGTNCGLDFNSGSPVALTSGQTMQWEGVATISDQAGGLLFYTDGMTVWNRSHVVMPAGTGLLGHFSATQSATIVPMPGSNSLFYIFTCPETGTFCYSIVDITLDAGMGDVTTKNFALHATSSEKCVAINRFGTSDVWVIGHDINTTFYSYLVTSAGINAPVLSTSQSGPCSYSVGYMKASPAGDKIAAAIYCTAASDFALYDFDCISGSITNEIRVSVNNPDGIYALEFSPDGSKLYAIPWETGGGTAIYQYDITLGSAAAIAASQDSIGYVNQPGVGDAQIGPDMKIYISKNAGDSLAVISNPDAAGLACGFIENAVYLSGGISGIGLPPAVGGSTCGTLPVAAFTAPNDICPGTCTDFVNLSTGASAYQWFFQGASPDTSTAMNPLSICYPAPGNYAVTLIATSAAGSDTLTLANYITVYPQPAPQGITQSGDTLFAIAGATSYQWYYNTVLIPGATDYFYVAPASGDYNVVATDNNGCEVEAVIFNVIAQIYDQPSSDKVPWIVFPNPVGEKLVVTHPGFGAAVTSIAICNMVGEIFYRTPSADEPLGMVGSEPFGVNCENFPPGVYVLKAAAGSDIQRIKFIKQ